MAKCAYCNAEVEEVEEKTTSNLAVRYFGRVAMYVSRADAGIWSRLSRRKK